MPKRKQMSNARLVREARAGLIPESDNIANEVRIRTNRTAQIVRTARAYLGSMKRVSEKHAIADILADLRHYCDCKSLPFRKLDKAAHALYMGDKAYEATWPGLSETPERAITRR